MGGHDEKASFPVLFISPFDSGLQLKQKSTTEGQFRIRLKAISISLTVGALLMAAKFYAFHLTRSSAVFSDALESIINVVASAFALTSIVMAAKPPDKTHPYGHGKVEYFSAGFEGALIIIAAFGIFKTGWEHMLRPQTASEPY